MNLPKAPALYDAADQAQIRRALETEDKKAVKIDKPIDRLLFKSPGGKLFYLSVNNSGAAVWTAA